MEKYAVSLSYPHKWSSGASTFSFDSLEHAKEFAEKHKQGRWGQEDYCQVVIYEVVEVVN